MVANDSLARKEWSAAEPLLSALSDAPAIWEVHSAYGHALAELGRWTESAAAFTRALARRPDSTELMYYEALARAAGGAADAIETGCAAALRKAGATRNPDRAHWLAALCTLANGPDAATRARVRDLARLAADLEPDLERFVSVHAMALLRANDPSRAAAVLEEAASRPVAGERGPETALVYALAQRELGRFKASTHSAAQFDSSPLRPAMAWHRRFEAETWRRELRVRK
jgi:tetratricopeptide (TPR) repeat protein